MTVYLPITVDLCSPYPLTVMNIPQYNTGRGALITLTAAGAVVVPDKESLYIYAKNSDGTVAYANCSLQGTQIKADFDEQMTAVAGAMDVEIQMVDSSGNSITTTIFKINVMASNIDYQKITSQDEFQALVSALAEVNELKKNGLKGDPGEAATLRIGTVAASDPGSNPEVTNSGTDQNAILNFVLPRGEQGPTGPPISTVDPSTATEEDTGKAADAYQTKLALDEQNVKMNEVVRSQLVTEYGTFSFITNGKLQFVYAILTNMPTDRGKIKIENFKKASTTSLLNVYSSSSPYEPVGSAWIYPDENLEIYKPTSISSCYISGLYILE